MRTDPVISRRDDAVTIDPHVAPIVFLAVRRLAVPFLAVAETAAGRVLTLGVLGLYAIAPGYGTVSCETRADLASARPEGSVRRSRPMVGIDASGGRSAAPPSLSPP